MPFTPDLSKLENDYQILTELHHADESYTVLARHLVLNRDVTITVYRGENALALRQLAADAIRLTASRQPNVVPVVEGRWLDDQSFALVRARVRGSTLDQVGGAVGGMPLPRVAAALRQVNDALVWSRENGVIHRHVTPEDVVFQQGSGRVLVGLSPLASVLHGAPAAGAVDHCADAHTIGELAYTMLASSAPAESAQTLASARPDLSPAIVDGVQRLLRCTPGDRAVNIDSFLALLGPAAVEAGAITVASSPTADAPVVVVTQRNGMGFGARLAWAVLILVVIGVGAFALVHHRDQQAAALRASTASSRDDNAGEVTLDSSRHDSTPQAVPAPITSSPTIVSPAPTPTTIDTAPVNANPTVVQPSPYPAPYPSQVQPTMPATPVAPPAARRPEPARPVEPPVIMPPASSSVDTTPVSPASPGDACDSPAPSDQRRCLMTAVTRNDRALNDVYQRLIDALRRQANAQPDDPDPPSVASLRAEERRWLESRDDQCHDAGSAPLYARDRAACFADRTNARLSELQQRLDAIGTAKSDTTVTDSVRTRP